MGCCCFEGSPTNGALAQEVPKRNGGKVESQRAKVSSRLRERVTARACSGYSDNLLMAALGFYCLHYQKGLSCSSKSGGNLEGKTNCCVSV